MFGELTGFVLFLWIVSAPVLAVWLISRWADRRPPGYYEATEPRRRARREL